MFYIRRYIVARTDEILATEKEYPYTNFGIETHIPLGANILSCKNEGYDIALWVSHDEYIERTEKVTVYLFRTGVPISGFEMASQYVNRIDMSVSNLKDVPETNDGHNVRHVFVKRAYEYETVIKMSLLQSRDEQVESAY